VRAVTRLCEFYPGICLTTEEKAQKNLSQVKKNLGQSTVYIYTEVEKPAQLTRHSNEAYWLDDPWF